MEAAQPCYGHEVRHRWRNREHHATEKAPARRIPVRDNAPEEELRCVQRESGTLCVSAQATQRRCHDEDIGRRRSIGMEGQELGAWQWRCM